MKNKFSFLQLFSFAIFTVIPLVLHSQVHVAPPASVAALHRFTETTNSQMQPVRANDPVITAMVAEVNADTMHKTLRQLQDWGSRFMLNDNRKQVATWLMNRFLSYGYADVKLDSFLNIVNVVPFHDTLWQYNVLCTLHGSSAPDEVYLIGGHYDSYSDPDPYTVAPGVDNNGSAVAATLEIARVMARMNYHPEATIRFVLYAAEELGVFGSQYDAHQAKLAGTDIRYMFSMDMIANNPQNVDELRGTWYPGFEWACRAAAESIERYTDLSVLIFTSPFNGGSDSYSYWAEGFPAFACIEKDFSPYTFTPADTLGNCNVPYCAKVAGGALATLAEQQLFPVPQGVSAHSSKQGVTLQWKPTVNAHIRGVNVYRSDTTGTRYLKISPVPVTGSVYQDLLQEPNKQYYYILTTVDDVLQESGYSQEVSGARFNFCDTLLVLASLKGAKLTPDSISAFYRAVMDTIPFLWHDVNATLKVNLAMLSRYRSVFWMTNSADFEVQDSLTLLCLSDFVANGGNLLFAGFNPMKFWINRSIYPIRIPETALFRYVFKVDSVDHKAQSMMYRANAVVSGYDTLHVDTLKYMIKGYPGQIYNVDAVAPAPEGSVTYRFDSKFDSTTTLGKLKRRPVALEYMGNDFKSILLSFPLYYLDTSDARAFMHYVMTKKFSSPVGIDPIVQSESCAFAIYPNPVYGACNVAFTLAKPGRVKLTLMSLQGKLLSTWVDSDLGKGTYWFSFPFDQQPAGLYEVVFQGNEGKAVRTIVKAR